MFVDQRWSFPRPVYIGDTIRAEGAVKRVHKDRPIAYIDFVVKNQLGEDVLRGEATVYQAKPAG